MARLRAAPALAALTLALAAAPGAASDHADPILLDELDHGITGLFVFPDGERLAVILAVHRGLRAGPPFAVEKITYAVHFDLHSRIRYDDPADVARYGGTVIAPEGIAADASLSFRLTPEGGLANLAVDGLGPAEAIRTWTGIRDDPFILPRFFGTNVLAMVATVPLAAFPAERSDWLIWATSTRRGWWRERQIDHVGRSNRTMLPRLDLLNRKPPAEQVAALGRRRALLERATRWLPAPLASFVGTYFAIRPYDLAPDVMIFSRERPPGFPNGRRLTDDVADLTCRWGDCLLWELSWAEGRDWPRATTNDKPFLDEFPYLAEPWPASP